MNQYDIIFNYYIILTLVNPNIIYKKFDFTMIERIQDINSTLQQRVPMYKATNEKAHSLYKFSEDKIMGLYVIVQTQLSNLNKYKNKIVETSTDLKMGAQNVLERRVDQTLSMIQKILPTEQAQNTQVQNKTPLNRVKAIIVRLNSLMIIYGANARKYTQDMIKNAKERVIYFCVPIYITLKASVVVTKEMMMEVLENRFNSMKVTYQTSKDTITMFIKGNFQGNDIKEKLSQGLKNFKNYTVQVAQKGLQIKVDKQSLFQNYDTFSLKFLEGVRSMKKIGNQNLTSIKERSKDMYNQIVNRIRQKELQMRAQYSEYLEKKDEKSLESHDE